MINAIPIQINPNGSDGLNTFFSLVAIVAMASFSLLARGEDAAAKNASEKSVDPSRTKIELRVLARPATSSIEQCAQMLQGVSDQSDQVKRVRKTLKKNLHFRALGSGHMILRPGWYADQSGVAAAHSAMNEDDIPVLVSLIGREKLKGEIHSMGILVLGMFGEKALPCIEAGMAMYPEQASALPGVKDSIEFNRQPKPKP